MPLTTNANDLNNELGWLNRVIDTRFKLFFAQDCAYQSIQDIPPPVLGNSSYAQCIERYQFGIAERITLALALAPVLSPGLLDIFFLKNQLYDRRFSEFGGASGSSSGFMPTVQTLLFILSNNNLEQRLALQSLFERNHAFVQQHMLHLQSLDNESQLHSPLRLSDEYQTLLTTGQHYRPSFGSQFPAQLIEIGLSFDDLVLHPGTLKQVQEIQTFITHGPTLMHDWGMKHKLRPGYRSLFYGPPGTGKTMTACILGKVTGRDVYKVDLSQVVSKYIGETEKNLGKVFDQAEHRDWILFFDEADALFGKRSGIQDAHDRYANQETAFLLQRLECFDGIAILASNWRDNLDEAFARRFETMIYFPLPRPEERLRLWRQGFSNKARLAADIDLQKIAKEHELAGGAILNAVRYASLQALARDSDTIVLDELLQGIRKEYAKTGKSG
ncbi:ATP-binding protein [Methylobacter sp.]|uniref:ATP-binding protein n=1 Tax=Methylobacter sp. TaxID=2051955 RepID=UPI002FDD74D7